MSSPTNGAADKKDSLKRILRIQVPVIAVLAEKRMRLSEVLNLNVGSIIQLDKLSEDLLDLMVNDQRVGRGETVRTGENFGLQLVEIGNIKETIRKLAGEPGKPADKAAAPPPARPAETPAAPAATAPAEKPAETPAEKPPEKPAT